MQYILSEDEYYALTPKRKLEERDKALEVARNTIMPVCPEHCDRCPIGKLALDFDNEESRKMADLMCTKTKQFHK